MRPPPRLPLVEHPPLSLPASLPTWKRVQRSWRVWRRLGAPRWVCKRIREGFRPRFQGTVPAFNQRNPPPTGPLEAAARPEQFRLLIAKGVIAPRPTDLGPPQHVSAWRLEPKRENGQPTGAWRFLFDGRRINAHTRKQRFRLQLPRGIPEQVLQGDHGVTADIKDYFYAYSLAPAWRKFFTIRAPETAHAEFPTDDPMHPDHDGAYHAYIPGSYWHYQAIPQGWCSSPRIAQKALKWFVRYLQGCGVGVILYVDDCLLIHNRVGLPRILQHFDWLLNSLGLCRHPNKGMAIPSSTVLFLGLMVHFPTATTPGKFSIPGYKLNALHTRIRRTLQHAAQHARWVPARAVAAIAGTCVPLRLASPFLVHFCGSLWHALRPSPTETRLHRKDPRWRWRQGVKLTHEATADLKSLLVLPLVWSEAPMTPPPTTSTLTTGASLTGYGAFVDVPLLHQPIPHLAGQWEHEHPPGDMTILELETVIRAVQAFGDHLRGQQVRLMTDNLSVMYGVRKLYSPTARIMAGLRRLVEQLREFDIRLGAQHIRSIDNTLADRLSRIQSPAEFRYDPQLLQPAERQLQVKTTVDCFASSVCRQPSLRYHSRYADPEAAKVDTYVSSWRDDVCWLTPPISQLSSTIRKIRQDQGSGLLLHPIWPTAPWWVPLQLMTVDYMSIPDINSYIQRLPTNPTVPDVLRANWQFQISYVSGALS